MSYARFHCCYHCNERTAIPKDCHIDCKKYQSEVQENERVKAIYKKEKDIKMALDKVHINAIASKKHKKRIK